MFDKFFNQVIALLERILRATVPNLAGLTNAQLNSGLSTSQINALNRILPLNTGWPGDDTFSRLTDFMTLKSNNAFGNTSRFTGSGGTFAELNVSTAYMIDHATGLGWYIGSSVPSNGANLASAKSSAAAFTYSDPVLGTLSSFRVPTANEVLSILNWDGSLYSSGNKPFGWAPLSGFNGLIGGTSRMWSQTSAATPGTAIVTFLNSYVSNITGNTVSTTTANMFSTGVRNHY